MEFLEGSISISNKNKKELDQNNKSIGSENGDNTSMLKLEH